MKIKQNIVVVNSHFLINTSVNNDIIVCQFVIFKLTNLSIVLIFSTLTNFQSNLLKTINNVFGIYLGLMMLMTTFELSKTKNQNPLNYINHTCEMICS